MTTGILYVATGTEHARMCVQSLRSMRRAGLRDPAIVISDQPVEFGEGLPDVDLVRVPAPTHFGSRSYKTRACSWSPWDRTLMLDPDILALAPCAGDVWSVDTGPGGIAACVDTMPVIGGMRSVGTEVGGPATWSGPVEAAVREIGIGATHYNTGVLLWDRSDTVDRLFERWHALWAEHGTVDQPAFCRAVHALGIAVAELPPRFNYALLGQGRTCYASASAAAAEGQAFLHFYSSRRGGRELFRRFADDLLRMPSPAARPAAGAKTRKNLLVVRAGDNSLHPGWLSPDRSFDLWVSYYGDTPGRYAEACEWYEHAKGFKFPPLADLIRRRWAELERYEYVGFPDDDLEASASVWDGVFDAARRCEFDLCQPALAPGSFLNHKQLAQEPRLYARVVDFVEIMTPVFRRDALCALRDSFSFTQSGFGVDLFWASRLPYPAHRLGVIDRYAVRHTRRGKTGQLYRDYRAARVTPGWENNQVIRRFNLQRRRPGEVYERVFEPRAAPAVRPSAQEAAPKAAAATNRSTIDGAEAAFPGGGAPFFFTREGVPAPLCDVYRGCAAFLICGGPSFGRLDHRPLGEPGILTMGLNNSVKTFRPRLWCCVDDPAHYVRSVWLDPTITKFVPVEHAERPIFDSDAWRVMPVRVAECPNVWYYRRNEHFAAERYLTEPTINWGSHADLGGGRSVMLAAVRILFLLGVRRLFLLGADFHMTEEHAYHFPQGRTPAAVAGNNRTYRILDERFRALRPYFKERGFEVYNCNPASRLSAFDHVPYEEALRTARGVLPARLVGERTAGLYERTAEAGRARRNGRRRAVAPNSVGGTRPTITPGADACCPAGTVTAAAGSAAERRRLIRQIQVVRAALHQAKERYRVLQACPIEDPQRADPVAFDQELRRLHAEIHARRRRYRELLEQRRRLERDDARDRPAN